MYALVRDRKTGRLQRSTFSLSDYRPAPTPRLPTLARWQEPELLGFGGIVCRGGGKPRENLPSRSARLRGHRGPLQRLAYPRWNRFVRRRRFRGRGGGSVRGGGGPVVPVGGRVLRRGGDGDRRALARGLDRYGGGGGEHRPVRGGDDLRRLSADGNGERDADPSATIPFGALSRLFCCLLDCLYIWYETRLLFFTRTTAHI